MSADLPRRGADPSRPGVGWRMWLAFLALATFTQIAFKWGGTDLEKVPFGAQWFETLVRSPAVLAAVLGYLAMFGVWMAILQRSHLSRAFLMTGLVYITVPLAAWPIFGERIGPWHAAGIVLIIAGVVLIGQTDGQKALEPKPRD